MESTEEESRKQYPSLPANYVSLAQLKERWLQQQTQKQEIEKQKEKQKQKQPQQEGKLIIASQNRRQEKEKKLLCENEQGSKRNGWRRVEGHQKLYMPTRGWDGNRPKIGGSERELKSEKFKVGAPAHRGVEGVGGMEETIVSGTRKKKNWKKSMAGVKSLIGEEDNRGNLGDLSWRNGGEERCKGEFGRNGNGDRGVEGNASVCMVEVAPKTKGKEVTLVGMGGKYGGDKGFNEQDCGNSADWRLGGSVSVCMVEMLTENGWGAEEVPVAGNGDDRGIVEAGSVCMVEVLPKNEVEEDCSVSAGRKRGEGRFGGRYKRNVGNSRKWSLSKDGKVELGCKKNEVEEGVFVGENERNRDQKGRTGRGIQAYGDKKTVSGNLRSKIRGDFRFLSLDESRKGNVTSRKGLHGQQQRRYEKSRDGGLVWVKKGEISDTNEAEI